MVASKIMKKMLQTRGQHHFMICLHKQLDIFCRRRKRLPGSLLFVPLCVCVSPCLHQGVYLPVCMAEGVFVQPLKAQPISPCVSLLWGSWGPACSCVQHPDPDTSCIHRHRPPLPFDVRSVGQPLTTDTLCIHQPSPVSKKKKKGRNNSLLFTCFYYLTERRSCLISVHKKQAVRLWALWGVWLIDCMGKVPRVCLCVQLLFKQPQAWESFASGRKMIN